jgi:hypothetical protein
MVRVICDILRLLKSYHNATKRVLLGIILTEPSEMYYQLQLGVCPVAVLHKQWTIRKQYYISSIELIQNDKNINT